MFEREKTPIDTGVCV